MSKLSRVIQRIFGETGGTGEFGVFGSNAASPPGTNTKDLTQIQSLSQYLQGWFSATASAAEPPRIEDRNSLDLLFSSQIAYLMQNGIPEWLNDADQRYYADVSFVSYDGDLYQAIQGDDVTNINTQKQPNTEPLWWRLVYAKPVVDAWNSTESVAYDTAGVIVERAGVHYASTGLTGNTNKDPVDPVNTDYWFPSPGTTRLENSAKTGIVESGEFHKSNNRADAEYSTSLLLDKKRIAGTTYEFYRVALDGTTVSGNATLEAIFDEGGANEYPFLDIVAPDSGGTRTLIDMGGRYVRAQSGASDVVPTLGQIHDDALQRVTGAIVSVDGNGASATGSFTRSPGAANQGSGGGVSNRFDFDIANSTSPNPAKTNDIETRVRSLVVGISYIIVMIPE